MKQWMRDHSDQIFIGSIFVILGLSVKGLISIIAPGKGKIKNDIPEYIIHLVVDGSDVEVSHF